ncbi:hypothetical protein DIPPA_54175 [Diplonema papillatum]|nr:hypothetical protein DIPPA_54175 [Diplonema papillatum]
MQMTTRARRVREAKPSLKRLRQLILKKSWTLKKTMLAVVMEHLAAMRNLPRKRRSNRSQRRLRNRVMANNKRIRKMQMASRMPMVPRSRFIVGCRCLSHTRSHLPPGCKRRKVIL